MIVEGSTDEDYASRRADKAAERVESAWEVLRDRQDKESL